jgi:hypothetical protein
LALVFGHKVNFWLLYLAIRFRKSRSSGLPLVQNLYVLPPTARATNILGLQQLGVLASAYAIIAPLVGVIANRIFATSPFLSGR